MWRHFVNSDLFLGGGRDEVDVSRLVRQCEGHDWIFVLPILSYLPAVRRLCVSSNEHGNQSQTNSSRFWMMSPTTGNGHSPNTEQSFVCSTRQEIETVAVGRSRGGKAKGRHSRGVACELLQRERWQRAGHLNQFCWKHQFDWFISLIVSLQLNWDLEMHWLQFSDLPIPIF